MAIIFAIQGLTQTTVTIGSGTSTSSLGSIPGYYGFHNSALLFSASEMTQGGVIQSFGLEISTASSTSTRSMKIYLKEVSDASLASSQIMNNLLDGATLVYDSTNVNCSITGWRDFVFETPFNYSGTNNLLVIVIGSGCTTGGGCSVSVRYSSTPSGKAWTKVIDNSNIDFSSSISSTNTYRFNSRFIMNDLPSNYCYPPSNFSTSSLTSSGVNLSWTSNSNPDSYTIEYKPSNSDTWISDNSTLNSYSFTGLNSATTYNVRVKSNCSSLSSTSIWSYFSFLTECDVISVLPFIESFDNYGTGVGTYPICWGKINTYSSDRPYINTTSSSSPGALYFYASSTTYNIAITPEFDQSIPINTLSAFFKLYKTSAAYNITVGVMTDPTDVSTFDSIANFSPTSTSTWQNFNVDFGSYTGTGQYIAFKVQGHGATNGMYIDDLEIIETPACAIPIGLTDLSTNTNSITLDWDATDDANVLSWIVEYKPIDSSEWLAQSAASHPFVLSGLLSGVVYQIRLYAICSDGDTTNAANTINVGMPCETITSFPWYEGFENTWFSAFGLNTGTRPWCWTNINGGEQANGVWRKTTSPSYIRTGSGALQMYSGSTSAGLSGDWFISPTISLTGNQILRFWAKGYSSYTDILTVKILNVTNNGSVAQESDTSLFVDIMPNTIIPASDWVEYEVNLGQFSGDYQIAFVRNTTGGFNLNIDDISITELPICARPTNVAINSLNSTEAEIKWISGHSGDASWYLYYKTNFDQFYDSILVNTNPYTLQNLIPQATYTYYLRTKCGTELSEPTNVYTFTTNCSSITQFPWYEGFEDAFVSAILPGNKTTPSCWYIIDSLNTGTYYWQTSTSSNTGSRAVYMYGYSSSTTPTATYNNNDWLISPIIHLTGSEKLNFWSKKSSSSYYPDLLIYALDISQGDLNYSIPNTNFVYLGKVDSTILSTTYSEFEFNLSSLVGDYRLAFVRKKIANGSVYIDDVKVSELSTCLTPTSLQATATATGLDLDWIDASGTMYNIQYMPSSESDWSNAITIPSVSTYSYPIDGLLAGTSYKFRVQTDCGIKQSEWSASIEFTTLCSDFSVPTLNEEFNSVPPTICWERKTGLLPSTGQATLSTSSSGWVLNSNVTPSNAKLNIYGTSRNYWLISPSINLGDGTLPLQLEFDVFYTDWNNADPIESSGDDDRFAVVISTDNGVTWDATNAFIWSSDVSSSRILGNIPNSPTRVNIPLINPSTSLPYTGIVKIGFYGESTVSNSDNDLHIDNFLVTNISSCDKPIAIDATSTTNSIEISITPALTTDNEWKVFYRKANSANWDSINVTTNPYTITNLQPQTEYEIYAKTLCSDATYSSFSSSILVETKQVSVQTSYACDFEAQGDNGWIIRNGTSVNKWIIGTPVGARSNALFISNNNTNASYAIGSYSVVIAEKLFEINSPDSLELSFDALIGGESTSDYLKVFLVDKDTVFSPSLSATYFSDNSYSEGVIMPNGTNNYINLVPASTFKTRFVSPGIGVQKKLIFVWKNDGSLGTQPSCYIDNIKFLNIITPYSPTNLEATPSISTSQLTWTPGAAELGWQVRKGETGVPVYVTTPSYQANALTPSTEYTYYIRSYYADDTLYSPWVPVSFRTLAIPQRVTTLAATNINQTTSSLHATLVSGTDPITDQGFEYRVSGTTTWIPIPVILDDTINYNLIGLSAYTDYEYRAYASTDYVTIYGKSQFFKTLPAPPTTVTNPATNIEQTIVTLNGVVNQGSMPITQQGFEWRLTGANTWTTVLITSNQTAITYNLTGLTPITDYEYRTFVSTTSESVYGTIQNFTTLAIVPPTIITTAATSITQTIATINASIILGSEIITDQGFEWRLSGESTWTIIPSTLVSGTITNNLTGLVASTDYEYRAYATTESGTIYGSVESFTTLAIVPPILITGDAIAVAQTIEILNGSITFGSESITDQGFEWRKLGETIWMPISVALVNNNMIHNLTGLTANTDYEFRAYAITESATTYGSVIAFRTLAMDPPIVTTMPATLLSQTSATLNGSAIEVMAPILSQGFEWRELGEASWTTVSTTINNDNLAQILTGLTAYTEYEFRAYAITSEGTTYGAIQSFRTLPILPTVVTNPATAITQIIATLNGSVAAGSETISLVGFEWRKQGISTWTTVELADYALVYNLSGIVASTNYEFRAFAITESGTTYGSIEIFTTLAIVPPIVVTNVSTMVGQTVATLNGAITFGSEAILSQGFEWKLASATAWTQISSTSVENVITHNLTGLTPNRQYEFRSFAVTESGTAYGSIETFTTLLVPQTVETNPATYITETNAILNANISAGSELITAQGFEWRTASSSTWITVTTPIIGNTITYNLTGLTPYVDYEFRAYATTASGTIYGQINSFTTLAIPTIVETNTATLVGQTQATLNGTITLGSKTVSSQGFEWKLASASNWTIVTKSLTGNSVSHNLTGLTANTAYEFRAFAINEDGTIYGAVQNFTTLLIPPTVATSPATLVAQTTATLNGQVTIGSEVILAQGFEINLSSSSTWTPLTSTLNGSTMSLNVTGLSQNSAYQYRAYATTLSGTVYGTSQSFTTLAIIPPTVVTNAASAITQMTAVLNGTITAGTSEITIQGFEWKLSSSSTWTALTSTLNGNVITNNLLGLSPNTAYQYRAYAVTPEGTVYGTTQNFTTLAILPPNVVTNAASAITQYAATMNGTVTIGSELLTSQGFEYKLASNSTWIPLIINPSGNTITYNLSGLFPDTMYHYRAFATTASGTVYGTTQNIITLAIIPPTVVSNAATAITQTTATISGTITLGSETLTTQGFEWALANSSTWNIITESLNGNSITRNLTNLAPNTGYKFRAYAETPSGKVYGTTLNFTTLAIIPPTVLTQAATNVTENSATINATVTQGTETIDYKGFVWRVANTNIWMPIIITDNTMSYILDSLTPNTTYEFRAVVITANGTYMGDIQSFTTLQIILPTVTTNPAEQITSTSAILSGNVVSGSETLISQGFEWKQAGDDEWTEVTSTLNGNTISYTITGLTPNHSYRYRAYALTASGITYGNTEIYTTSSLNEAQGKEISINLYPNPASSQTQLVINDITGSVTMNLIDVRGRILRTINSESIDGTLQYNIDLNGFAAGVYYVRINNSNIIRTQKLIVK